MDIWIALGLIALVLLPICLNKDIRFKNDSTSLNEYYLKYRLSEDEDYKIAFADEFEEISKVTSDFLLVDIDRHETLDKDSSMRILNSENSDIMLGLGDWVQVWYKK